MQLTNMPEIKLGIVGVSRDCFPASLTARRLAALAAELKKLGVNFFASSVIVENEADTIAALEQIEDEGCNAVVAYLGNFGPETPTTILLQEFNGPAMVVAAAEENKAVLSSERGDALCGLLNCSYNLGMRRITAYIPEYPVGLPEQLAPEIADFVKIARVVIGLANLKLVGFAPRPQDFFFFFF